MSTPSVDRSALLMSSGRPMLPQLQERIAGFRSHEPLRPEAPRCSLDEKLKALLEKLQKSIVKQVENIPGSLQAPFSWIDECLRLQTFYSSLRYLPDGGPASKVCIAIRRDVYQKASDAQNPPHLFSTEIEQKQRVLLSKAWEHIGNIVVCAEKIPQELEVVIATSDLEEVLSFAEKRVADDLQKTWGILHMKSKVADAHALQDEGKVYLTELPKELAKLLLTSQGQLNLGMVRLIKERFFPKSKVLSEEEQGILFVLAQMDSSWQKLFDTAEVPRNSSVASNAMIRADLGLSHEENITKLHCQQEVLGAVLSQMCQPQVRECLTSAVALKRHREFLRKSIKDYIALIRDGCLTRWVNGSLDAFFFENTLLSDSIYKKITLKQNGSVIEFSGSPFWKCPNLIAACRLMGITDLEKQKETFLNQAALKGKGESVAWDDLIDFFAHKSAGSEGNVNALLSLGRYGFCLESNRLLKAWETSLIAAVDSSVRKKINKTVMQILENIFKSKAVKASYYRRALIEESQVNLKQALNHSFRLVYDEAIPFLSEEGAITANGFKLFKRDLGDCTAKGTRVASPKEFRSLILGVISALSAQKKETPVIDALKECVLDGNFMKRAIYDYDEENEDETDPISNYAFMEQTPMTTLVTGHCPEFTTLDTINQFNPNVKAILSKNPGDLLQWMLHFVKWKNETKYYLKEDEALLAEGEEFQQFLTSKMSVEEWIKRTIIDPGMLISSAKIEADFKVRCQEKVRVWLFEQFIDKTSTNLKKLDGFFRDINSNEMTVRQFAERSYNGLLRIFRHEEEIAKAISLMWDSLLLQSLPEVELWNIQQNAVRFAPADSKLFFCCFFNPRTELIDLGSISLDKTGLKPMDQQEWEEMLKSIKTVD